jgi:hypothetical protein
LTVPCGSPWTRWPVRSQTGRFVYTGCAVPALAGKLLFGDVTTRRMWSADIAAVQAADDGVAATVAAIHPVVTDLRERVEAAYRARGGKGEAIPGFAAVAGRGRVDLASRQTSRASSTC